MTGEVNDVWRNFCLLERYELNQWRAESETPIDDQYMGDEYVMVDSVKSTKSSRTIIGRQKEVSDFLQKDSLTAMKCVETRLEGLMEVVIGKAGEKFL